jgi:hypothetical protein
MGLDGHTSKHETNKFYKNKAKNYKAPKKVEGI